MTFNWGNAGAGALQGATGGAALGPWGALAGGLLGGIGGLFGGDGGPEQYGSPDDVTNVNPYTDAFMQQLQGQGQNWNNMLQAQLGQDPYQMDPAAAQEYFLSQTPAYQQIAQSYFDPYASEQRANYLSNQAIQNISSQFGNQGAGALRSSGSQQAIMQGALNPLTAMNERMAQQVGGTAAQLAGQGMGQIFGRYNLGDQLGAQGQQARTAQLAQLYGNNMGMQGQFAAPEWWQPGYSTGGANTGMDFASGFGNLATAANTQGWFSS